MTYQYNPNDFGPGAKVTPEMAAAFFKENANKIVIMLMMRLNEKTLVIGQADVDRLVQLGEGSALITQTIPEGIRLTIAGPGFAATMGRQA